MGLKELVKNKENNAFPGDWELKRLADMAEISTGNTPPTRDLQNYGSDYLFASPADLGKGKWILDTEKKLSKKGFSICRKFPKNSILFTCIGSTIGKSGMASIELTSNQQINAVLPNDNYSSDFLFYALDRLSKNIKSLAGEQAVPIINKTQFGETIIPVPSKLFEQSAIATALSDADALISSLEKLIAKKHNIKQGAMQELLKPKKGWEVKRLGDICKIFGRIGFRGYTVADIVNKGQGAISLSPSNIQGNKMNFEKCTYISWFKYEESPEIKIFNGDILLVKTGSTFGKTAFVRGLKEKATVNPQIVVLKEISVNNSFLSYVMNYKTIQDQIVSKIVGGAIPTLSQQQIANFRISIPKTRDEQDQIANILCSCDDEISVLESKLAKYRQIKTGMMQNLLTGKIRLV